MVYNNLAKVYDFLMKDAPYDEWIRFTEHHFKASRNKINYVADLGCGTGEITIQLAELGYKMIGIDRSEEMLTFAEQKAYDQQVSVQWIQQDLRNLEGFKQLDAIISYCDVINYITTPTDLEKVFQAVYESLSDQGLFIFDVHALNYAKEHLMNHTFTEITDEVTYIWECFPGENEGEMHHELTFFCSDGKKYDRFDEYHIQRTYPESFYTNLLKQIGFQRIEIYNDFSTKHEKPLENIQRVFFVVTK